MNQDKKLNPLRQFLEQIRFDLPAFKESVRVELEHMGLRITSTEQMMTDTVARVTELEQKMRKIQVSKESPCGQEVDSSRFLSMVVGNIPEASTLDEASEWLGKHCRASGIGPSDVDSKGPFSNVVFVKCQVKLTVTVSSRALVMPQNTPRPPMAENLCQPSFSLRLTCLSTFAL